MTLWRMCPTCWTTKAINTHLEYIIPIAFPWQQCLDERVLILSYILCSVCISEQTAIISKYKINQLVFVTETVCSLRGTS